MELQDKCKHLTVLTFLNLLIDMMLIIVNYKLIIIFNDFFDQFIILV
jgi:hypothetical protein